jgi:hypothetical protein
MGYQTANDQIRTISTALIAFYRKQCLEWEISADLGFRLDDHLYVIEFRAADCDVDELFGAFVKANEALERKAYGTGQHHFGIGYLAKRPDRDDGLIRALVIVEPGHAEGFRSSTQELARSRSGFIATKCETDAGDPDAHWRWLTEGILESIHQFEAAPRFALIATLLASTPMKSRLPRHKDRPAACAAAVIGPK